MLALHRIALKSSLLHSLGIGSILSEISLWGRSAAVSDRDRKARSERLAIFVRLAAGIAVVFTGSASLGTPSASASPSASATLQAFRPVADSFVTAAAPRRSFGRSRLMIVRGHPVARAYLRFRISRLDGDAVSAKLQIYVVSRGRATVRAHAVDGRLWDEPSLSYANAPRLGRAVSTAVVRHGLRNIEVGRLVSGLGAVEVALTVRRGSVSLPSREANSNQPRLVVQTVPTLLAAGDIASCESNGDEATAALLTTRPGTIAPLGDLAYESGTSAEFNNCYAPTWGRFKARSRPAVGNHEYLTPGAAGYFQYWGMLGGAPNRGYYSYTLGSWHIIVLNSNCGFVACYEGSPQEAWLQADLAAHPSRCTLAYWHEPLFSSTPDSVDLSVSPFWQALSNAGAEVILSGHTHNYQRYAPQTAAGMANPERGIREFVVGTGGRSLYPVGAAIANEEVWSADTFGVLKLTLRVGGYAWHFIPAGGGSFRDAGSGACH